ncbi:MAG: transcriptional activator NhaR [Planctomycetota bacterium]|nr:transcriptional activator NhaR [Planctomycetota bacterium]
MDWLNYHHLLYFWVVAREGSIARASEVLMLAPPTISSQIKDLELTLGEQLFTRSGRRLVLTDVGKLVYRYADEIFTVGRELLDTLKGRPTGRPLRFVVGIADVVPKLIAHRLLRTTLSLDNVRLICRENTSDVLLAELAVHGLDLVLSDSPIGAGVKVRAFSHLLGESGVSICAAPRLASSLRRRFPRSLDGAPFLLPTEGAALRRSLEQWFDREEIRPRVVGEFDDSALLAVFGQAGEGAFAIPTAVEDDARRSYGVRVVKRLPELQERFYAITIERKVKHPAAVAMTRTAKAELFAPGR